MKVHLTVERRSFISFDLDVVDLDELHEKAEKIVQDLRDHPEQMDSGEDSFDYAATDENGYQDLIPWKD